MAKRRNWFWIIWILTGPKFFVFFSIGTLWIGDISFSTLYRTKHQNITALKRHFLDEYSARQFFFFGAHSTQGVIRSDPSDVKKKNPMRYLTKVTGKMLEPVGKGLRLPGAKSRDNL